MRERKKKANSSKGKQTDHSKANSSKEKQSDDSNLSFSLWNERERYVNDVQSL